MRYRGKEKWSLSTVCGRRMAHRKWKETKQLLGTAGPGPSMLLSFFPFHVGHPVAAPCTCNVTPNRVASLCHFSCLSYNCTSLHVVYLAFSWRPWFWNWISNQPILWKSSQRLWNETYDFALLPPPAPRQPAAYSNSNIVPEVLSSSSLFIQSWLVSKKDCASLLAEYCAYKGRGRGWDKGGELARGRG